MKANPLPGRSLRFGRNEWLITLILLLAGFLAWLVLVKKEQALDETLLSQTRSLNSPGMTSFMKAVSFAGNHLFLIPANLFVIGLALIYKRKDIALAFLFIALSSLLLNTGLKELFSRPRPLDPMVPGITNYSFPSGHALMGVAFFGLLIWVSGREISRKDLRMASISLLVLLLLLIGFSRVYLRVHYPSDVIAGYCIGIAWLWIAFRLLARTGIRVYK